MPVVASPPPARAIVQRAYERLRSYGTPPYVVYLTDENGDRHRIAFRASDEMMNDSEYYPNDDRLPLARIYRAFVGPLSITVHESIVKTTPSPGQTAAPAENSLVSDLKTIAVVSAYAQPVYTARTAGVETIDGHKTDHVALAAVSDPSRYTLRDLWIDTTTYDVWRADYVTHDVDVPGSTVYLTVNFEPVGPYWIAAHWIAIYHFLGPQPPVYRELAVLKMRFPATLAGWLWNEHEYEQHRRARDPDPLGGLLEAPPGP